HDVRIALRSAVARTEAGATSLESLISRTRDLSPASFDLPESPIPTQIATSQQATARTVFLTVGQLTNVSVTFDPQFQDVPAAVTLRSGMTVRQALDAVAAATHTFYQITAPSTVVVIP